MKKTVYQLRRVIPGMQDYHIIAEFNSFEKVYKCLPDDKSLGVYIHSCEKEVEEPREFEFIGELISNQSIDDTPYRDEIYIKIPESIIKKYNLVSFTSDFKISMREILE